MANKRLSNQQIEELQKMVIKGVYPDDIAKYFGIAVSSIHNYKNRMRNEGIKFPSIKGKKPVNAPMPGEIIDKVDRKNNLTGVLKQHTDNSQDGYKFIINGLSVLISAKARSVNITNESMVIQF